MSPPRDLKLLRGSLGDAAVVAGHQPPPPPVPPSADGPAEEPRRGELWPGCPVTPLGVSGETFWYLDTIQQLRGVTNHTTDAICGLFGGKQEVLCEHFPRMSKGTAEHKPVVIGWAQDRARAALQRACTEMGVWQARERVRGAGAWADGEGGVILHCGNAILIRGVDGSESWAVPGQIGDHVYPGFAPGPRPEESLIDDGVDAAGQLRDMLATWAWQRGEVDAHLLLGWIVAAMFGGALDWRPMAWITGDAGTGKSTLHKLIRATLGGERGLITATDASEAGLRQYLGNSTLPVALDEIEAEADNRKTMAIVKLARQAASGGVILRGGADHEGAQFRAKAAFMFSSILIPPLLDQDISRIGLFELRPLAPGAVAPKINEGHWQRIGARLRRRVLDHWGELHGVLARYQAGLVAAGHSARGADQFGVLLAMADLVLTGGISEGDAVAGWCARLRADDVRAQTDQSSDWERMLGHLCSQLVQVHRGSTQYTVGEFLRAAAELPGYPEGLDPPGARAELRRRGIGVVGTGGAAVVEIANSHGGLAPLFRDTHWAGGVHAQAVRRVPGATAPKASRTFAGAQSRCWQFPMSSAPWLMERGEVVRESIVVEFG